MSLLTRTMAKLPSPMIRMLAGRRVRRDGKVMDPASQLINRVAVALGSNRISSPEAGRALLDSQADETPYPRDMVVEDRTVDGPAGPIPVRMYEPAGLTGASPALVYLHGGGWVIGSLKSHDATAASLAHRARCIVIAVDYRLAPEHPHPAGPDDAYAVFRNVRDGLFDRRVDHDRVAVGGDSAGGNLAAVVCQRARDRGESAPCFQMLIYPGTDLADHSPSKRAFEEGFLLTRRTVDWFVDQYVPDPATRQQPDASPLRAESLADLPPAHVAIAWFDPLRDEGLAYAERLMDAGVPVDLTHYDTTMHGFFTMGDILPIARQAQARACRAMRHAFNGEWTEEQPPSASD